MQNELLTVGAFKRFIEENKISDDVLLTCFDCDEGTRDDLFVNSLDTEWVEENGFLDININ